MSNEVAVKQPQDAIEWAVAQFGVSKEELYESVKVQCFGGVSDKIKPFHMTTYLSIAKTLNLNPLMPGQMYGFPTKSGQIQIILGPDGLYSVLRNNPDVKYWRTTPNFDKAGNLVSATARIYVRSCEEPFEYTALLSEWRMSSSPVWGQKPTHMLEYRALKQCARYVVGNGLLPDREEAKMAEVYEVESEVVTPASASKTARLTAAIAAAPIVNAELPPVVSPVNVTMDQVDGPNTKPLEEDAKAKARRLWDEAKGKYPELYDTLSKLGKQGKKTLNALWLEVTGMSDDVNDCVSNMMSNLAANADEFLAMACPPDVLKETRDRISSSPDRNIALVLEAIGGGW